MPICLQAVIFDMDGVIIDSNPEIEKFWHGWAQKTNRQLSADNIARHIYGRKGVETLDILFGDISIETKEAILQDAQVFDSQMAPQAVGGVFNFIQQLCNQQIPLGLVTSSHKNRALLMLEKQNLQGCFTALVTAEDVTRGKPDPQPYLAIAQKIGIEPQQCLVFEDALSGVLSAVAAGMHVIGINTGQSVPLLLQAGAAYVVPNFTSLQLEGTTLKAQDDVMYCF